jgi:hypothetical protein
VPIITSALERVFRAICLCYPTARVTAYCIPPAMPGPPVLFLLLELNGRGIALVYPLGEEELELVYLAGKVDGCLLSLANSVPF